MNAASKEFISVPYLQEPRGRKPHSLLKRVGLVGLSTLFLLTLELSTPFLETLKSKNAPEAANHISAAAGLDPNYLKVWASIITEVSAQSSQVEQEAEVVDEPTPAPVKANPAPIPKPKAETKIYAPTVEEVQKYKKMAEVSAKEENIPGYVFINLIQAESEFNPKALSKTGAKGIMQFVNNTAAYLKIDPYDPVQAIPAGAKYLKENYNYLDKRWDLAVAAYYGGPGLIRDYLDGTNKTGLNPEKKATGGFPPNRPDIRKYVDTIIIGLRDYTPRYLQIK